METKQYPYSTQDYYFLFTKWFSEQYNYVVCNYHLQVVQEF